MTSIFNQFFNLDKKNKNSGEIVYLNEEPKEDGQYKIKATIYGIVQGVGFRFSTVRLAKRLKVNGIVRNENDGSVYVEANGEKERIEEFIQELAKGPSPRAQVEKVEVEYDSSLTEYTGFGERY